MGIVTLTCSAEISADGFYTLGYYERVNQSIQAFDQAIAPFLSDANSVHTRSNVNEKNDFTYTDDFAGVFIDDNGVLNIGFTNDNQELDLFAENVSSLSLGGVCGYNSGTLENCYNYASLGGTANIGGIVGLNYESAQLIGCKNYGDIYYNHSDSTSVCIAGIAGTVRDKGVVKNCSNYGNITWAAFVGPSRMSRSIIALLVAQICTSASDVNNYAGGEVVIVNAVRLQLEDEQLVNVKNEKFAVTFNPPGSSSGGDDDGGGCVALGTLITLADGTQVTVESLTGNELLLVWDMRTGTFGAAPILFIDCHIFLWTLLSRYVCGRDGLRGSSI